MIRKITVRPDKVPAVLRSLTLVKIACDVARIEYAQHLDHNFRSPVIHSKLNQSSSNLEYSSNQIRKDFLTVPDIEVTEGITFKIHEAMQFIMKLDEPTLDELIGNLKKVVEGEQAA